MFLQILGLKKWIICYWVFEDKYKRSGPLENHTSAGMVLQAGVTCPSPGEKLKNLRQMNLLSYSLTVLQSCHHIIL